MKPLDDKLLAILACPKCKGTLAYSADSESLDCHNCRLRFEVRDGIPILLIEDAQPLA